MKPTADDLAPFLLGAWAMFAGLVWHACVHPVAAEPPVVVASAPVAGVPVATTAPSEGRTP